MVTDLVTESTLIGWLEDYARLKHQEALLIEKEHGPGWISDGKYAIAKEVQEFLKRPELKVDEPISSSFHTGAVRGENWNLDFTECKYADGTIIRTIKTTEEEIEQKQEEMRKQVKLIENETQK